MNEMITYQAERGSALEPLTSETAAARIAALAREQLGDNRPVVLLVGGGTASGKSTFIQRLEGLAFKTDILSLDLFYHGIAYNQAHGLTFEHPEAVALGEAGRLLQDLRTGTERFAVAAYDFVTACRKSTCELDFSRTELLLVDGLFALHPEYFGNIEAVRVFVEADPLERGLRRFIRDARERPFIPPRQNIKYFLETFPLYQRWVESTREYADIVVTTSELATSGHCLEELAAQAIQASSSYADTDNHIRSEDIEWFTFVMKRLLLENAHN